MNKISAFLILISFSIIFIFSCQKDKTYEAGDSNNLQTTVTGIVLDETNAPLNGVTVTGYGQTTTTNQYGTFVLKNINANKDRCVLQFAKAGFFNRAHGFIASANTVNYVRIVLISNAATQTFSASAGGTVSLADGSSAEFQPNSFVTSNGSAYTGTVNLIVKHLSPDDANFGFTIPGGDLLGKNLNDEDVALYTYGMLGIELTGSSGEALQLAAGTSATLTMVIAASQLSSAPATIPLWFFDETSSLWKEEGSATKVGNNYVGSVAHFSWWNCDVPFEKATIKGKVVDCNGNVMSNVEVTINEYTLITDQNGEYQNWVPVGFSLTVQVLAVDNGGIFLDSQLENVPALSSNQTFVVPDLIVSCPTRVAGVIKACSGENTDGIVSLSNNAGFNVYQYTTSGDFNLMVIPNEQLELNAFNQTTSYHQTLISLSAPNELNLGNIFLCDTISNNNYFILSGNSFSNQTFYLNILQSMVYVSSGIQLVATSYPDYNITYYYLHVYDTIPGSYTNGNILIEMSDSTNTYVITANPLSIVNLTQVDSVGGKVKGNFSGSCTINGVNGTISGNFDVVRDY